LFQAIGDVDEANSAIGVALLHVADEAQRRSLTAIQNELFDLGADLATPGEDFAPTAMALRIVQPQIDRLEREIDSMNEGLAPLRSFILPAGGGGAAWLHLARAIVRRAERSAVAAAAAAPLNPLALIYLNRLSDHLFVMARQAALAEGGEVLWKPGATRD
jgi:cob(I)alamin adenosyltransferase